MCKPQVSSRRHFLEAGSRALAGAVLGGAMARHALGQTATTPAKASGAKAKAVILVYLAGGISQVESFDPKPTNGQWNGPKWFKAIPTNVPGIEVSEGIPRLAKVADKYSILRSMTHPVCQFHGIANYVMTTGTVPSNDIVYPSAGSIIALKKGDATSALPPYVFLTEPGCVFTEESFLPPFCAPYATGGDPSDPGYTAGLALGRGLTPQRVEARQSLLQSVDRFLGKEETDGQCREMIEYQNKACKLLLSEGRKVFDLSQEKKEIRERYGMNWFGQCALLARKLVEAENGVKFVKIFWQRGGGAFGGWDTHDDAQFLGQGIRNQVDFDQGMSALFEDLSQRGLLDSTVVLAGGEMGRDPRGDANRYMQGGCKGGRGHHSTGFSWIVGGGGFQGGRVVGKTDNLCHVVERPVYPWDLWASVYKLLDIAPTDTLPYPLGCGRVRVSPLPPTSREMRDLEDYQSDKGDNAVQRLEPYPRTDDPISGGLLAEIM